MEIEVATLFQIIGEQYSQILELERQLAEREPVTAGPRVVPPGDMSEGVAANMTPVSDEMKERVGRMFKNG